MPTSYFSASALRRYSILQQNAGRLMDNPLAHKKCIPCSKGTPALKGRELKHLLEQLQGWRVVEEHHLEKSYSFPDFKQALDFVNQVGAIAEQEGHHPDIYLSWGRVKIQI